MTEILLAIEKLIDSKLKNNDKVQIPVKLTTQFRFKVTT